MSDEKALREFISKMINMAPEGLQKDAPLLSSGLLNSINLLQVIQFIEKNYKTKVTMKYMAAENFDSIERILELIPKLRSN